MLMHGRSALLFASVVISLLEAGCAGRPVQHGTITTLSASGAERCPHQVPADVCTRCNPALVPRFKAAHDWCVEHEVPESQCFACHPDLTFEPLPPLPEGADLRELSRAGEDVPDLARHAVPGKITLFDFYAVWCAPCRKVDGHVFALLGRRQDIALRKLNVVDWETPLARRYLKEVPRLPFVVVYGRNGQRVKAIVGLDLPALDRAIEEASAR